METEPVKLGRNLRRIRKEKGFTQADIAEAVGISCPYLSNIENGKVNATISTVARLAKVLKVSVDDLIK